MYSKVEPQILSTSPHNFEQEVSTTSVITIAFNTDLHRKHIQGSMVVAYNSTPISDSDNLSDFGVLTSTEMVQGETTYDKRTLTFTPNEPLIPGTVYRVTIISDPTRNAGVRSVLNDFMSSSYSFTFATVINKTIPPITPQQPADGSVIRDAPIFAWKNRSDCMYYHIEVSRTNTFSNIFWEHPIDNSVTASPLKPIEHFDPAIFDEDGIYYWRVRGHGWQGQIGDFSSIFEFNIDRTEFAPVTPEDTLPYDPADPIFVIDENEFPIEPNLLWPELGFSNVATNLRSLILIIDGKIDATKLTPNSFLLTGEPANGDPSTISHGNVNGVLQIQELDNKTLIVFTPDVLGGT